MSLPGSPSHISALALSLVAAAAHGCVRSPLPRPSSAVLDRTEVTVAAYRACVDAKVCPEPTGTDAECNWGRSGRDDHPINCVTWVQAYTYCDWRGDRLPTDQEWVYAAGGPEGREYPWGDEEPTTQLCWKKSQTCPVGSFPAGNTPEGLQDMAGNVYEWTSTPGDNGTRVYRSMAMRAVWPQDVRISRRSQAPVSLQFDILGFRCATQ